MHFVTRELEFHNHSFVFAADEKMARNSLACSLKSNKRTGKVALTQNWQGGIDTEENQSEKGMYAVNRAGDKCPVRSFKYFLFETDPNAASFFNRCSKTSPRLSANRGNLVYHRCN